MVTAVVSLHKPNSFPTGSLTADQSDFVNSSHSCHIPIAFSHIRIVPSSRPEDLSILSYSTVEPPASLLVRDASSPCMKSTALRIRFIFRRSALICIERHNLFKIIAGRKDYSPVSFPTTGRRHTKDDCGLLLSDIWQVAISLLKSDAIPVSMAGLCTPNHNHHFGGYDPLITLYRPFGGLEDVLSLQPALQGLAVTKDFATVPPESRDAVSWRH